MNFLKKWFGKGEPPESPEFTSLIEGGQEALRLATAAHQGAWNLGEEDNWEFSQETGELILQFPNRTVRIKADILGSFDSNTGTWLWAWANSSIDQAITGSSRKLREYGQEHGITRLTKSSWPATEASGWEMAGLTFRLCGAQGAYRGPAGATFVFFTFNSVTLEARDDDSAYRPRPPAQ